MEEILISSIVGGMFGLAIYILKITLNNRGFSKFQKLTLIVFFILPPLQLLFFLLYLLYNKLKKHNKYEEKIRRKSLSEINKLVLSKKKLLNLFELGILNNTEYQDKLSNINNSINRLMLLDTIQYKNLEALYKQGILTKKEFVDKTEQIINRKPQFNLKDEIYFIENKGYTIEEIKSELINGNKLININSIIKNKSGLKIFIKDSYIFEDLIKYL